MRKTLVLALAALGIQYLTILVRMVLGELHPRSDPALAYAIQRTSTNHRGMASVSTLTPRRLTPRRVVITTLEPRGVL